MQLIKKNGEPIDVLFSAVAEREPDGEIRCALVVIHDMTARKRMEAELRDSQRQLRQWNEQLTDYNRVLTQSGEASSHEIARRQQVADSLRDMVHWLYQVVATSVGN